MAQSLILFCNRGIKFLFYSLLFLVPVVFAGNTYELFEFNKMWVTFSITIFIMVLWITKSLAARRFSVQRTPLDIPILLFLLSQFIATIHSLDVHVSIWGYYSRWNGGLLSMICYVLLYFAFVSNFAKIDVRRVINVSLITGLIVALWGLPSHFGHDPTCFMFRGTFDVSCWTNAFQPTIRMFSTIGQPDWFAAYFAVLIPLALARLLHAFDTKNKMWTILYALLTTLLYMDLIWSASKSGFIAIWIALAFFFVAIVISHRVGYVEKKAVSLKNLIYIYIGLLLISFMIGIPTVGRFADFTFPALHDRFTAKQAIPTTSIGQQSAKPATAPTPASAPAGEFESADSGKIRLYVWQGALDIWKANPLFGTGVETFAFAYYMYRPTGHNMTTEWDYLYNKAHNEYLNYLATTGAFGLGTYLVVIGLFFFFVGKKVLQTLHASKHAEKITTKNFLLVNGFVAGYISILITNFFGFSVVIINEYLFLIPAFCFLLMEYLDKTNVYAFGAGLTKEVHHAKQLSKQYTESAVSGISWAVICLLVLIALFLNYKLIRFWQADTAYALGNNLDQVGQYDKAYPLLHQAVQIRGSEPTFLDELSINDAVLAVALAQQKQQNQANQLAQEAIAASDKVVGEHPNDVVFWKTRVRMFYTLAQAQPNYLSQALEAVKHAKQLAPTDAKIAYNLGLVYGQSGDNQDAINTLQDTVKLKPNYAEAWYALGLFYHEAAIDKSGKVVNRDLQQKAVDTMHYLLTNVAPGYPDAQKSLKSWGTT